MKEIHHREIVLEKVMKQALKREVGADPTEDKKKFKIRKQKYGEFIYYLGNPLGEIRPKGNGYEFAPIMPELYDPEYSQP